MSPRLAVAGNCLHVLAVALTVTGVPAFAGGADWHVVVWSLAGGAMAGLLMLAYLLVADVRAAR